jgi:hypothetical protein
MNEVTLADGTRFDANELLTDLWSRGEIDHIFKLHKEQAEMFQFLDEAPPKSINYIEATRGFGKTSGISMWMSKQLYKRPKTRIIYGSSIKEQIEELADLFLEPLFDQCPKSLRPRKIRSKYKYEIPNGSFLRLVGLDKDKLRNRRGPQYDIAYFDEISMIDGCYDMVFSSLYPMVERRNGIFICSTTPALTPFHDSAKVRMHAQVRNRYFRRDVYQCSLYTPDRIASLKDQLGEDSISWRREYELRDEADASRLVIPEFKENLHVINSYQRPEFYNWYVFMDLGFDDYTHILFVVYDFRERQLVVEDEICVHNKTTDGIALLIKQKETELEHIKKPRHRISDNNPQQLHELSINHSIQFSPKVEYDRAASINRLRVDMGRGRIKIHSRCKNLISQLKYGIMNKKGTDYERIDGLGHLDGIDAMRMGIRMVSYEENPYPPYHGIDMSKRIWENETNFKTNKWNEIANA